MRRKICLMMFSFSALFAIAHPQQPALAQANYPSTFLWGAAISAHQVEGLTGGGENATGFHSSTHPGASTATRTPMLLRITGAGIRATSS